MKEIITILGGGSIIIAAIVWLAKTTISKAIDAGTDAFKHRLDKDLEVHKKNLDLMKIQFQIQYSSLNEKRGEIISSLYSLLYDLEQDLLYYTDMFQGPEWVTETERDTKAAKTMMKTKELFEKNRIYFDSELCDKLDRMLIERENVIKSMRKAKITAKHLGEGADIDVDSSEMPNSIWSNQYEKVRSDIADSRKRLADEFRTLFGIELKMQEKENN